MAHPLPWLTRNGAKTHTTKQPSSPSQSQVDLQEQHVLEIAGKIAQTQQGSQLPEVSNVIQALHNYYSPQEIADTLEWLEGDGYIEIVRAFSDPDKHKHRAEAWSF